MRLAAFVLACFALIGCAGRVDRSREIVNQLRFRGIRQIDEAALRERLATQATPRVLGVVLPFTAPEYYDPTTFRRDLQRIERFYQTHGYYSAAVQSTRIERHGGTPGVQAAQVEIDVTVREGEPTRVATIWISGCEPETVLETDRWRVPEHACERIRNEMRLKLGEPFSEAAFETDRVLITDLLREEGRASARVVGRSTVDPVEHRVHVVYVLDPGPPSTFGDISFYEASEEEPVRGVVLPSGYPLFPVQRAISIRRGQAYSRTALADAQRRLFELRVFGIVRINEIPHRCDSAGRCDALRDVNDPRETVRVDLGVHLSPNRPWRQRYGGGAAVEFVEGLRGDIHLLGSLEHRNAFGGMRNLRAEVRPLVFFNSSGASLTRAEPGVGLLVEFRQPQVWQGGTFILSALYDFGPDPINPGRTNRSAIRGAAGFQHQFSRQVTGAVYARANRIDYLGFLSGRDPALDLDPIFREQYASPQTYGYLDQQFLWDRRDNPLQTRRGFFIAANAQEGFGTQGDPTTINSGSYSFLRGSIQARGYLPLGDHVVLAARGFLGAAVGSTTTPGGWPVPQELRFYSGGSSSNRGYPYNRVGYVTTVARQSCLDENGLPDKPENCGQRGTTPPYVVERSSPGPTDPNMPIRGPTPDITRLTSVGGLAAWELSAEIRVYFGNFGAALFFDASDVTGWMPDSPIPRRPDCVVTERTPMTAGCATPSDIPNSPRPNSLSFGRLDPHPSVGIGLRYISPIGVLRIDVGVRIDDLNCGSYQRTITEQNGGTDPTLAAPTYYAFDRPRCIDFIAPLPIGFNIGIGEVY